MRALQAAWVCWVIAILVLANCNRKSPPSAQTPSDSDSNVVFRTADGRVLTEADLEEFTGTANFEITTPGQVSATATNLHAKGREAGATGNYARAIELFDQAAKAEPTWPYPIYDKAYSLLLLGDASAALESYRKVVELSPSGFFTAITAVQVLEREQSGDLPRGTYVAYLRLEWMPNLERYAAAKKLVQRVPNFAPAWKEVALYSPTESEQLEAVQKGLAANPDPETKGQLQIRRATLMDRAGDQAGAIKLLAELILDASTTIATKQMAKISLKSLRRKR